MQRLLATLDDEIRVLDALVRTTQTEQQHLLAFEPEGLDLILQEKMRLLAREDVLRQVREQAVGEHLAALGADPGGSLLDLIERLPEGSSRALSSRRSRLRALLGALAELNAVAGYHAKRQLRWVQQCRKSLEVPAASAGYGPDGARDARYGTGRVLTGTV